MKLESIFWKSVQIKYTGRVYINKIPKAFEHKKEKGTRRYEKHFKTCHLLDYSHKCFYDKL